MTVTQTRTARSASRPPRDRRPFFARPGQRHEPAPFFRVSAAERGVVQRDEKEKKDPAAEGAKLTVEKALEKPEVKAGLEHLWNELPPAGQASLMSFGGVTVGMLYAGLLLSPKLREKFSDVDVGKPLSLIPYVPIEGFTYKLPAPGKSGTALSADFSFKDYFELIREHRPGFPISNLTFSLEGTLAPSGGFGLTGGKAALEFFGGGLKAEGGTFTEVGPYPIMVPGAGLEPPSMLMQSFPGLPPLATGFGGQFMLSADLAKLFPGVFGGVPGL